MLKKYAVLLVLLALCAPVFSQDSKELEKQARDEVSVAMKEKRIAATDISKYYELISKGKSADVIKELRLDPNAGLGGAGVKASEKQPLGWRGDGTGKYPGANPPTDWARIAKGVKTLAATGKKPKGTPDKKDSCADGFVHQWLIAGPFPTAADTEEALPGEKTLAPEEKDKAKDCEWKAVTLDNNCVDFCQLLDIPTDRANYTVLAYTNLYYSSSEKVVFNMLYERGVKVWLNGALIHSADRTAPMGLGASRLALPLVNGWNKLMVRVDKGAADRKTCWFTFSVYGDGEDNSEYETKNIAWSVQTAAGGASSPVIAGDKIFVTCDNGCLSAFSKRDGKRLWSRTLTYFDFVTEEERKKAPAVITELASVAAKLKELDQNNMPAIAARAECEDKLMKGMLKVDPEKYNWAAGWGCEAGWTAGNPVTDGKYVYVLYGTGIIACYDLDGKPVWSRLLKHVSIEHGYTTSPMLVDGKLIIYTDDFNVLDADTGKSLITRPHFLPHGGAFTVWAQHFHAAGVMFNAGLEKVLYYMNGEFVRISDGKSLKPKSAKLDVLRPIQWTEAHANRISTPVVENNICYKVTHNTGTVVAFKLSSTTGPEIDPEIIKEIKFNTDKFAYYYENFYDASQLLHEGLLYCLNDFGTLTVVDVEKGEVVYQKQLDLEIHMPYSYEGQLKGGASAAPTLAGKYIYIFGNQGTCLVLEPGRAYKQVARLRLECVSTNDRPHQDVFMTNPVFEGDKIYVRSESYLWCIGKK